MSFFDDAGKKITETSQGAAQKAKSIAETVKLNGIISDEERRIYDLFTQIGRTYYETYGSAPEQQFVEYIAGISDARTKIVGYNEQIKQLKRIVKCVKCGGDISVGSAFCNNCGTVVNTASPAPAAILDGYKCSTCGKELAVYAAFCTGCGNKINR